jgi:hypothetical protein
MKKIKYITGIVAALILLYSCNDWLDVNPRSMIKDVVIYETEDGFKRVLIGAYMLMSDAELYGENTSMYMPEAFTRHWTLSTNPNARMNLLAEFNYNHSSVEDLLAGIWLKYYNTIAQLNDLLENLENAHTVWFQHDNDVLIKGEALGLRAFLHLDLLRYFGPVPA